MEGDKYDRATKVAKALENAEKTLLRVIAQTVTALTRSPSSHPAIVVFGNEVEKNLATYEAAKAHFEEVGTVVDCPPGP